MGSCCSRRRADAVVPPSAATDAAWLSCPALGPHRKSTPSLTELELLDVIDKAASTDDGDIVRYVTNEFRRRDANRSASWAS